MNKDSILKNIINKKSYLCIGLDTDINKIPEFLLDFADPVFEFNKRIVDATHKYAISYKPNTAFYEAMGVKGWETLEKTAKYIKEKYPEIFLIADAKRGDIGNTSKMYARAFFEHLPFDAVTVAPYMGSDSVLPFLEYSDKWVILLALTSNKGAYDFQFLESGKKTMFEHVLRTASNWGTQNNLMFVVGATKTDSLKSIRNIIPDNFLLVPGVGAQGGSLQEVAEIGMNNSCGLIVNSSRGIIYADQSENFDKIATQKAYALQKEMEQTLSFIL